MKLSELEPGYKRHSALARQVLAVLCRRVDGWCVYIDAVEGYSHDQEWQEVARSGSKLTEPAARAIVESYFRHRFEIDLPYAA